MRALPITTLATLIALGLVLPAHAQGVPNLNVDPVCRGIAQQAGSPSEKGGPDLAFSQCVQSEQAVRQKLIGEWSTFTAADQSNCVSADRGGGLASYTDLVSCLEMARDARQMNRGK